MNGGSTQASATWTTTLQPSAGVRQVDHVGPSIGVLEQLPMILSSEYGLAAFEVRRRWVSTETRVVLEVESSGGTLAVKIDTAAEPATLWGLKLRTGCLVTRRALPR